MQKPASLRPGDKVAIVSLSRGTLGEPAFIHKYYIAKERMEQIYGLTVVPMPNALKGLTYLYDHPDARAADLMTAFRDPSIKAVFNAVGGDDTIRLLPYIDFDVLRQNPKIFTGFSDTTTNHFMMRKADLVSYYGASVLCDWAEYVEMNPYTKAAIDRTLFAPTDTWEIPASSVCSYDCDKVWWDEANVHQRRATVPNTGYEILQGHGRVTGQLLGGCIDVFRALVGTELWPAPEEWQGKLLLLETSEENMDPDILAQWLRGFQAQGILSAIRGIVVGKPAFAERAEAYKAVYRQVVGFEAGQPDLPILFNVNIGHAYPIGVLPLGLEYAIDCDARTFTLLEPATQIL